MRKIALALVVAAAVTALGFAVAQRGSTGAENASSHREAPLISEDPTADNTDLYAFGARQAEHVHDRRQLDPR